MNPDVWGPQFWFVIHTMAMTYPLTPNEITKRKYYSFINDLPLFLPHRKSAETFSGLLEKYPVKPYLDSRASFVKWAHFVHNKVNFVVGKPQMSSAEATKRYNELFKPKTLKVQDSGKLRERLAFIGIVLGLCAMCAYAYKKVS